MKWHEDEAQLSRQRRASAVGGAQGNGGKGGNRRGERKPDQGNGGRRGNRRSMRDIAGDESRKETADRVARHHRPTSKWKYYATRAANCCSWLSVIFRFSCSFCASILRNYIFGRSFLSL